jgi:DNA polymerase-3 subunit gamma/tau
MSEKYIPLYRKYRPQTLQEMVGQEHVKKALANAINLNKITHAYLFTGPRGTGKTSAARILAKSLNCKEGPTVTPCGKCPSCSDITSSTPMDVIEIDAASNRSVEDARNILEKIQYIPVNGKFKIYIIDEVHMLTPQAFNALLKTLEEPPENVIFILATTEPHKVLETITSRCQRFDFRRITTDDIIAHLKNIAESEKIKINAEALFTIAKNAAGGMRDALALLDQVSVLDNTKTITADDVNSLLGRLSFDVLNNLSDKIIQSKPQEAIEILEKIYNSGNEPTQILTNLLGYFKNVLVVKNCQESALLTELTQLNEAQIKNLQTQAKDIDTHQIVFLIERISYYIKEVKTTNSQHLWLEISMIDLANLAQNTSLLQLQERLTRLESGGAVHTVPQSYTTHPAPIPKTVMKAAPQAPQPQVQAQPKPPIEAAEKEAAIAAAPVTEQKVEPKSEPKTQADTEIEIEADEEFSPMPKSQPTSVSNLGELWRGLLSNIESPPARALLSGLAKPIELNSKQIVITFEKEMFVKQANDEVKKQAIINAAETLFDTTGIKVTIRLPQASDKPIDTTEKKKPIIEKPAPAEEIDSEDLDRVIDEIKTSKIIAEPKKAMDDMPSDQVTMVMNLFDGKYID